MNTETRTLNRISKLEVVITSAEPCESCGKEFDPISSAKNLEENFINDIRQEMTICSECFKKRFKIITKKRSGYGGTIYEIEERSSRRFGTGSQTYSCLKCDWVAWTEEGLLAHMRRKHS
ncbi:MAG: hypothetical protein RTV72_08940 [Candidatus Thorarchaeota archaeon]